MSSTDEVAWNTLNSWAFDVVARIPQPVTYAELLQGLAKLSPAERGLAGVKWTDAEVFNGGFYQLFINGGGFWAAEAVEGFRLIGRPDFSEIVVRALAAFPNAEIASMRDQAEEFLDCDEEACNALEACDRQFGDLEEKVSMGPNILAYAHARVIDGVVQ